MKNNGLDNLLDLDGVTITFEDRKSVKFKATRTDKTKERPHGISYSLTFHDASGKRLLGFANAHAITSGKKKGVSPTKRQHDHWHRDSRDKGRPYNFVDAGTLVTDFWKKVDNYIKSGE